ncbi:MAG TPA: DEAD/DEAH box helicase [Chthoniobacteraceae bacterium]|nr:box helicase domain protein [Chthoniobacter sp.]HEV7868601.1 DEAD/DEAH box helicase [Chthoniobacteraceae bacterium]
MSFKDFGLLDEVVQGVEAMGYTDPTPIQLRAFPIILSGGDMMGSAQTGTGKTAAFALPILTKLKSRGATRCLVLEPTRELAAQVETAFRDYARFMDVTVGLVHGGVGFGKQRELLTEGVDVLVATPGRLLDFLGDGTARLGDIEFLVLDEVDRMLDMGFLPQVRRIVDSVPKKRQTMFFSATLPPELETMTKWLLKNPEAVEIGAQRMPADTVTHALYPVAKDQKFDLLVAMLERTKFDSAIIFTSTKIMADKVAHRLKDLKHSVAVLHSNRTQREREDALAGFKSGKYEVMVATDIAARGLDIAGVSHVINYDVPQHPEDYVHRIGRTGRALNVGDAFTIFTAEEMDHVRSIERFIGTSITRQKLEGFEYLYTTLFNESSIPAGGFGKGVRTLSGYSFGARRKRR